MAYMIQGVSTKESARCWNTLYPWTVLVGYSTVGIFILQLIAVGIKYRMSPMSLKTFLTMTVLTISLASLSTYRLLTYDI